MNFRSLCRCGREELERAVQVELSEARQLAERIVGAGFVYGEPAISRMNQVDVVAVRRFVDLRLGGVIWALRATTCIANDVVERTMLVGDYFARVAPSDAAGHYLYLAHLESVALPTPEVEPWVSQLCEQLRRYEFAIAMDDCQRALMHGADVDRVFAQLARVVEQ